MPAGHFDALLRDATQGVSTFDRKDIELKDVTEEFLDIQARLKTKKELENRYLEILKQANTVAEILEVEKEMGHLRSDIESIEGRLKFLENNVSLSTLTLTYYQNLSSQGSVGRSFIDGFKSGWENLIVFMVFLVNIWPFLLLAIAGFCGFRLVRRKKSTSVSSKENQID